VQDHVRITFSALCYETPWATSCLGGHTCSFLHCRRPARLPPFVKAVPCQRRRARPVERIVQEATLHPPAQPRIIVR
jgi:hypothetical protein